MLYNNKKVSKRGSQISKRVSQTIIVNKITRVVLVLGYTHVQGQAGMVLPRPPPSLLDVAEKVPTRPAYQRAKKVLGVGYNGVGPAQRMSVQIDSALAPPL